MKELKSGDPLPTDDISAIEYAYHSQLVQMFTVLVDAIIQKDPEGGKERFFDGLQILRHAKDIALGVIKKQGIQ